MNLADDFRTFDVDAARQLIERLGKLHLDHAGAVAAGDRAAARRDVSLAVDLAEHATLPQLRAAVILASMPTVDRPAVPVVPGPQDRPGLPLTLDEIDALLRRYAQACFDHGRGNGWHGHQAFDELWAAIQGMHLIAFAADLHAQAEGRTP